MWRIKKARNDLSKVQDWKDNFTKTLYRPFDIRKIYFHDSVVWRTRKEVMRHMMHENLGLLVCRQQNKIGFYHAFISEKIVESCVVSNKTREINYLLPLYLYPDKPKVIMSDAKASKPKRVLNISKEFLHAVKETLRTEQNQHQKRYLITSTLFFTHLHIENVMRNF